MKDSKKWVIPAAAGVVLALVLGLASLKAQADASEERVATIIHLMNGINKPAMAKVSAAGNRAPATDKEWRDLETSAALLNESGFLLMEAGRGKDDVWTKSCVDLKVGGAAIAKAAAAKDHEAVKANVAKVGGSCKACHDVHQTQ